jgi:hypothetical protein
MTPDERSFYDHAVSTHDQARETKPGRLRKARDSARVMEIAEEQGWSFEWDEDPEPYMLGDADKAPSEVLTCTLCDANGDVLEYVNGIGMSGNAGEDRELCRVIEAEISGEAARRLGLLRQLDRAAEGVGRGHEPRRRRSPFPPK